MRKERNKESARATVSAYAYPAALKGANSLVVRFVIHVSVHVPRRTCIRTNEINSRRFRSGSCAAGFISLYF